MTWAITLPHGSDVRLSGGSVAFRNYTGTLVVYRPRRLTGWALGPVTTAGRRLEALQ